MWYLVVSAYLMLPLNTKAACIDAAAKRPYGGVCISQETGETVKVKHQ